MPTLVAGSNCRLRWRAHLPQVFSGQRRANPARGFTLLELLVVITLIAVATVGVTLALPDSAQTQVEREAQRLAALLESARAQSRLTGVAVRWRSTTPGFRFDGLPTLTLPERWLNASTDVRAPTVLLLGPEPLLPRQSVTLVNVDASGANTVAWRVATDGLRPFTAEAMSVEVATP